ncbi:nitrite reductase small subunit NirD [Ruania alba]|uniref:Assimilatory nitrite reductase (NAD(P)H) small subunit n=1 Tax=Ruania alba TaxID=648782 RepID=A0A1H5DQ95_9MICO|nr:nitrite reductase small subunit NirD [Ruania alba]SED81085.1 assimilatory nitrite reductase (NAD(P)H) small subunit [Ruania alba]
MSETTTASGTWNAVCSLEELTVERGAAALVDGVQMALFRMPDDAVYAVAQRDPFSGSNVMSRGIVGTRQGEPTVAGPLYKQVFSLRTGACLERAGYEPVDGDGDLPTWPVQVVDAEVRVQTSHTRQAQDVKS